MKIKGEEQTIQKSIENKCKRKIIIIIFLIFRDVNPNFFCLLSAHIFTKKKKKRKAKRFSVWGMGRRTTNFCFI